MRFSKIPKTARARKVSPKMSSRVSQNTGNIRTQRFSEAAENLRGGFFCPFKVASVGAFFVNTRRLTLKEQRTVEYSIKGNFWQTHTWCLKLTRGFFFYDGLFTAPDRSAIKATCANQVL